jgi:2-polyprenyl-6-methoxyphenol hydroxylase-like FAD-dependent oxidoreductase
MPGQLDIVSLRMRIAIIGGGPAGLYFAYLMQRQHRRHRIVVIEQNPRDVTWGFGVVFSHRALDFLRRDDPDTFTLLQPHMETWPDQQIVHGDERVLIDGNGFSAIPRLELLRLLQGLAEPLGVDIRFATTADDLKPYLDADLVVGADGINSMVRSAFAAQFRPSIEYLSNKFAWYGTAQRFGYLTLTFRANRDGAFVAHHYRYSPSMSTFIVECDAPTWERAGFARISDAESRAYCERVFAPDLGGHALVSNKSVWRNFPLVTNEHWTVGNVVLIGDALRSVHFSIGSGTRLAMEDALFLSRAFSAENESVPAALARFTAERRPLVDTMLAAAAKSCEWYEQFAGKMHLDAYGLAYDYMTRSGRMTDARLAEIAPRFMAALATRATRPTAHRA